MKLSPAAHLTHFDFLSLDQWPRCLEQLSVDFGHNTTPLGPRDVATYGVLEEVLPVELHNFYRIILLVLV